MRPDFRARSTISGPIPAQSPSVIPIRFGVLPLMLVSLIDFAHSARTGLDDGEEEERKKKIEMP